LPRPADGVAKVNTSPFNDDDAAPPFSEEALALAFASQHGDGARYVAAWNKWIFYDGQRWRVDEKKKVLTHSRHLIRAAAALVNKLAEAKRLARYRTNMAVVSLAQADEKIAAGVEQWDADPWLLNTPSGVVDLRTGAMRPHAPEDYMTKITAVAPEIACPTPLWHAFLDKVTNGDEDFRSYLMRMCGYSLTGITREHALFFLYGPGGNGKTTWLTTVAKIMGDYHCTAPIDTFTDTGMERHPTELAMLQGARLVTATETEEGRRWAESRIKVLTGGDPIRARFMRQDFFEFEPQFKLVIAGNHKPGLRSVDEAIRRRFNMLPFVVKITEAEKDKEMTAKLKAEWPGILAQTIAGCLEWQRIGLTPPKVVTDATEKYMEEEDAIGKWLQERLVEGRLIKEIDGWASFSSLHFDWKQWAEANGEKVSSAKWLSARLEAMEFSPQRRRAGAGFCGLAWASNEDEEV
jgi:putative DNA primase/helicase